MCRPDSFSDQRPKVGLPSHSAPQPLLEASVMTTFLLCAVSKITHCFSQKRSLPRARADTHARVTVTRPWRQAPDGTLCFSQNWIGHMWSRNRSTGKAAAISVKWTESIAVPRNCALAAHCGGKHTAEARWSSSELESITSSYHSHYPLWYTGNGLPDLGLRGKRLKWLYRLAA